MPKAIITRQGLTVEADLTFDQLKELLATPVTAESTSSNSARKPRKQRTSVLPFDKSADIGTGDFATFYRRLSERPKKFLAIVQRYPHGIDAFDLAHNLGLNTPAQIGGITGPGVSTMAQHHGINVRDLYRSEIIFPNGERKRMFYPGKLLLEAKIPA